MSSGFDAFLGVPADDRRDAFIAAGRWLGTAEQNVEKDFWVCWILDALFNRLPPAGPRLLFKGGTSLSKAFELISRFSKDIDVTVFRDDLVEGGSVEALERLSGKKRRAKLDAIKAACQAFIAEALRPQLAALWTETIGGEYPGRQPGNHARSRRCRSAEPAALISQRHQSGGRLRPAGGKDRIGRQVGAGPSPRHDCPAVCKRRHSGPRLRCRERRHPGRGADLLGQGGHPARPAAMVRPARRVARRRPTCIAPLLRPSQATMRPATRPRSLQSNMFSHI